MNICGTLLKNCFEIVFQVYHTIFDRKIVKTIDCIGLFEKSGYFIGIRMETLRKIEHFSKSLNKFQKFIFLLIVTLSK